MVRTSRAIQDAIADAIRLRFELGREIRPARLEAGTSLRTAAARAGISHTQFRRIELGMVQRLSVTQGGIACAAVGLRLHARAVPGSGKALDAGQLKVLARLQATLPASVQLRREVPIPMPGDRRAWDGMLGLAPDETPVEAETHLRDVQALDRRAALKLRDSGERAMVLLVADTPHNRHMLELYREDLRASFPLNTREMLQSLRAGRTPPASGIVVL